MRICVVRESSESRLCAGHRARQRVMLGRSAPLPSQNGDHGAAELKSGQHLLRGKSNPGRVRTTKPVPGSERWKQAAPDSRQALYQGRQLEITTQRGGPVCTSRGPRQGGGDENWAESQPAALGPYGATGRPHFEARGRTDPSPATALPPAPESALHGPPLPPVPSTAERRGGRRLALPLGRGGREREAPTSARPRTVPSGLRPPANLPAPRPHC